MSANRCSSPPQYQYEIMQRVREYVMGDLGADLSPGSPYFARYRIHTYSEASDSWAAGAWSSMEPSRAGSAEQRALFVEPPLVPFYGEMTGFHEGRPPLLEYVRSEPSALPAQEQYRQYGIHRHGADAIAEGRG